MGKIMLRNTLILMFISLFFIMLEKIEAKASNLVISEYRKSPYTIIIPNSPSETEEFAALELQSYIELIGGVNLPIKKEKDAPKEHRIFIGKNKASKNLSDRIQTSHNLDDRLLITVKKQDLYLLGNSPRSTLYAVYDFLEEIGCRWYAPNLTYYEPYGGEFIPSSSRITYHGKIIDESGYLRYRKPEASFRKGEDKIENLFAILDWMAKNKANVFWCQLNKSELADEVKKRGLLFETGGHVWGDLLDPEEYFSLHPEWFSWDGSKRKSTPRNVFCTSNQEARSVLIKNTLNYLQKHPWIDIFNYWANDTRAWCECERCKKLGSTSDRHALVINEAVEATEQLPRHPIIEFIAYFGSKIPPQRVKFHRRTVMDYCTTNRNFSELAFSSKDEGNKSEAKLLKEWISLFPGDISIYSYYRKAAWRSLPIIIPWTVTEDIRKFKETGVKGLQWYLKAPDWRTYELHHYVLLKNCWEKEINVEEIVAGFGQTRYGGDDDLWQNYFKTLENTISNMHVEAGPQYSKVKQTNKLLQKADQLQKLLSVRLKKALTESEQFFMDGLIMPLEYLSMDFEFFNARLNANHCEAVKYGDKLLSLMNEHKNEGIFIDHNELRNGWYLRKSLYQALSSSAQKCREYNYINTLKVDSEARPSYDYWYPVGPHQAIDGNINRRWMSAGISGVSKSWYIVEFKDRHNISEIVIVASPQNPFRSVSIEWKDRENKWNKMKGSLLNNKEQNTIEVHPFITTNAIKIWVNEVKPNTVKTPVHGYETPNQIAELYIFEGDKLLTENGKVR